MSRQATAFTPFRTQARDASAAAHSLTPPSAIAHEGVGAGARRRVRTPVLPKEGASVGREPVRAAPAAALAAARAAMRTSADVTVCTSPAPPSAPVPSAAPDKGIETKASWAAASGKSEDAASCDSAATGVGTSWPVAVASAAASACVGAGG
eukprot:CAMPEP_0179473740 /NCGR_PEP_ID=MMETSP0799-20121207/53386_1 /TAXON_ID=46947 /ORGANISM="Geminigera cryophila, Strain CCMP2564" /LENGTH=151 /DNA_ID=CAMNT_0021282485 /DNA_START=350 /DNA_END=807 /DNA_ORIENTATION=+